jgi:pSer/pThr/pTyr-binding forkhead associated (FHA) protein
VQQVVPLAKRKNESGRLSLLRLTDLGEALLLEESAMAEVTFQVVEGLEAGRVFRNISTPLTIGREEDNDIQLNDERISRFHVKVQEDSGRVILTDLESTNGTRVNGHPVRLRVLRPGDLIMLGRCVLLVGDQEELRKLNSRLRRVSADDSEEITDAADAPIDASELSDAFPGGPPPLPSGLTAVQTAELVDLLEFLRTELLTIVASPVDELHTHAGASVRIDRPVWQHLQSLCPELARMLNLLTRPEG